MIGRLITRYKQWRCVHLSKVFTEPRPTVKERRDLTARHPAYCEKCKKELMA